MQSNMPKHVFMAQHLGQIILFSQIQKSSKITLFSKRSSTIDFCFSIMSSLPKKSSSGAVVLTCNNTHATAARLHLITLQTFLHNTTKLDRPCLSRYWLSQLCLLENNYRKYMSLKNERFQDNVWCLRLWASWRQVCII